MTKTPHIFNGSQQRKKTYRFTDFPCNKVLSCALSDYFEVRDQLAQ